MKYLTLFLIATYAAMFLPKQDNSGDGERKITIAITAGLFKSSGQELPVSSKGKLTAQLFSTRGGGEPIWTEVSYGELTFPDDRAKSLVIVLGDKVDFVNPATSEPLKMKDPHWLLLTFESAGKTYSSPRLALSVSRFAHESDFAHKPAGQLKATVDNYETRIKKLETTLAARESELAALTVAFLKLREEVLGTPTSQGLGN